jgi:carboxylesterase
MTEYAQRLYHVVKKKRKDVPEEMRIRYSSDLNIINKPFHFKGTNDTCVILVHGWTSTPYEMRVLGEGLNAEGFAVDAPLLTGHGAQPELLEFVTWQQWVSDVEKAYERVRKQYRKVYVGGMSMGGNLALHVAAKNSDIDGLILMSTPYDMRFEKIGYLAANMTRRFARYKKKYYPRILNAHPSITQLISYQYYPISSAFEAFKAIKSSLEHLEKITQPVFIVQPEFDHLVSRKSIHKFYKKIGSEKKEKRYVKKASHNFMGNGEHKDVFQDVVDFVKNN